MTTSTTTLGDGDFRNRLLPRWFDEMWNYPRNNTYGQLQAAIRSNRLPGLSIFVGPPGSGKTASAKIVGMVTSCTSWHPVSHAPCGTCSSCRYIQFGESDGERREAFFEIDGADREDPQEAVKSIYEAFRFTSHHTKAKMDGGDPKWRWVIFIDEAHRLLPSAREGLLTLTQKMRGVHVILATMSLHDLAVHSKDNPLADALILRATVYNFDYPTPEESASGLIKAAVRAGLRLTDDAAAWIAIRHNGIARSCLGTLYQLSSYTNDIGMDTIRQAYGDNTQTNTSMPGGKASKLGQPSDENDPFGPEA